MNSYHLLSKDLRDFKLLRVCGVGLPGTGPAFYLQGAKANFKIEGGKLGPSKKSGGEN